MMAHVLDLAVVSLLVPRRVELVGHVLHQKRVKGLLFAEEESLQKSHTHSSLVHNVTPTRRSLTLVHNVSPKSGVPTVLVHDVTPTSV